MPRLRDASNCSHAGLHVVLACALTLSACGGASYEGGEYASSSEALTGSNAVMRGDLWVNAEVPYCQSPNDQPDPDTSCSPVCMRPMNAQWDPYRSDCSGFVSWSWDLPPPGRTTDELAPAVTDITEVIDGNDLQPGDALNIPSDHIVLFVSWITPGQSANFYEEPGCSANPPYAHAFTSDVEISGSAVTIDYEGSTFTAIRYLALTGQSDAGVVSPSDAGTSCFVSSLNQSGMCMLTSTCASEGGTSTPGYCPGPADIQCCTMASPPPGCTSDSQCSSATPFCDTSSGSCVQCVADSQCSMLKPICSGGTCQGCVSDSDCTGNAHGGVCQMGSSMAGACVACTQANSSACKGATPVCDEPLGACVGCLVNSDCKESSAPVCNMSHVCVGRGAPDAGTHLDAGSQRDAGPHPDASSSSDAATQAGGCTSASSDLALA